VDVEHDDMEIVEEDDVTDNIIDCIFDVDCDEDDL